MVAYWYDVRCTTQTRLQQLSPDHLIDVRLEAPQRLS